MEDFACNLRVVKTKGHFFFSNGIYDTWGCVIPLRTFASLELL